MLNLLGFLYLPVESHLRYLSSSSSLRRLSSIHRHREGLLLNELKINYCCCFFSLNLLYPDIFLYVNYAIFHKLIYQYISEKHRGFKHRSDFGSLPCIVSFSWFIYVPSLPISWNLEVFISLAYVYFTGWTKFLHLWLGVCQKFRNYFFQLLFSHNSAFIYFIFFHSLAAYFVLRLKNHDWKYVWKTFDLFIIILEALSNLHD